MKKIFIIVSIVSAFLSCKYNPLFEDKLDSSDGHTITGVIDLQSGDKSDSVFVWLEQLRIGTFTNQDGLFSLILPLPILQPENGISTESRLYYYLGNYAYSYSNVKLLNGKIVYGKLDVSHKGKINQNIKLQKLAIINTTVEPDTINLDYQGQIKVQVSVSPTNIPVFIRTFAGSLAPDFFDGLLYKHVDDSNEAAVFIRYSSIFRRIELKKPLKWYINLNVEYMVLREGNYTFVPYIDVVQTGIPEFLFDALDESPGHFSYKYLNLPFKRKDGFLTVISE